jgi:hypothetical protein
LEGLTAAETPSLVEAPHSSDVDVVSKTGIAYAQLAQPGSDSKLMIKQSHLRKQLRRAHRVAKSTVTPEINFVNTLEPTSVGQLLFEASQNVVDDPVESDFLEFLENDEAQSWDSSHSNVENHSTPQISIPSQIFGGQNLQKNLQRLCLDFSDIFSRSLNPQPALLDPMEIAVELDNWQTAKARCPPRIQTRAKEQEVEKQVSQMLALGLIRPSQSAYYSQVHLVPKPNDKWRFCIDYRDLNSATKPFGWPIPHIGQTLQRIGRKRPRYFAKFDMTSGYFQCPLSEASKELTAFITFMGTYEWQRVPMGQRNAGNHFQQQMATKVLAGLLYHCCELYIDDVVVHAETETELIENIRKVFDRFRRYKITLNPDKCILGVESIEYTGHVIDASGLSFTEEKLTGVLAFPKPTSLSQLKSFIGLVNYFRDHVRNMSIELQPLQALVDGYNKRAKHKSVEWTPELVLQFERVKRLVHECQKLYFMDDTSPIFLETDASDYGIGAFLYQLINNEKRPIAFISKSLSAVQQRWSVPEKECFAIVYAFHKLAHLLRDRHFTLRTDHENLTRNSVEGSPKVLRWKLAMQQYNFTIEFIQG